MPDADHVGPFHVRQLRLGSLLLRGFPKEAEATHGRCAVGWKSTVRMSRAEMEQEVLAELLKRAADLGRLSDADLEDLLEQLRGGERHGDQYRVVPQEEQP